MPGGWYVGTLMLLYISAPIIVWIYQKIKKYRTIFCIISSAISILMLIGIVKITGLEEMVNNNAFGYYFILNQYPCFSFGILLYFQLNEYPRQARLTDLCTGVVFLFGSIWCFFNPFQFSYVYAVTLVGITIFYFARFFICEEKNGKAMFKRSKVIIEFGKRSYGIFLTHAFFAYTLVGAINSLKFDLLNSWIAYILLYCVVCLLSYFSGEILNLIVKILGKIMQKGFKR